MRSVAWYVVGFLTALIVAVIAGVVLLNKTAHGFSANAPPTLLEVWAARKARDLGLPNTEKQRTNPVVNTPEVLSEARAHWADHCAVCHANDGSGQTQMGEHMYPRPPDMRKQDTQELAYGELFYIIQNGIRLSGDRGQVFFHSGTTIFPGLRSHSRCRPVWNVGIAKRFSRAVESGVCFPQSVISTGKGFYSVAGSVFAFLACSTR